MVAKKATKKTKQNTALAVRPRDAEMLEVIDDGGEVAIQRSNLSVYSDAPSLDSSDLFIPKLRLAQGLSTEVQSGEAKPGQWLLLGAVPAASATVVIMGMAKRRELRDGTRAVLCRSADSLTGIGDPGGDCGVCEFSHWQPAPVKKGQAAGPNKPPQCTFIYSYMVFVIESKKMAILEFSRTGELAARMINTMLVQSGFGNFAVKLTSTSKQGPQGLYYSPAVAATTAKPEDLKRAMAEAKTVK